MRRCSWLFSAKCLMLVPTFRLCTPWIIAVAIRPARTGSSEKYSKFRPHRGLRLMFTAGPSTTDTRSCWQLSPIASPIARISSGSKDAAVAHAVGKHTALMLSLIPRWSAFSSCFRSPCGPSLTMDLGIPRRSTDFVCQKSSPEQSPAFYSRVIWETSDLISMRSVPFCPVRLLSGRSIILSVLFIMSFLPDECQPVVFREPARFCSLFFPLHIRYNKRIKENGGAAHE